MKFGKSQKIKFKSNLGAYSIVTPRENYDSQITATDAEAELLTSFFGKESIQVGNVKSNPVKAKKAFRLFPGGNQIYLNLVFPKPEKTELRLYLSSRAGYKPEPNDIWFLFEKDNDLWIGSLDERSWRNQNRILIYDESESEYQDSIQALDDIKVSKLNTKDVFVRDRKKALARMEKSNYQCEFDVNHNLFVSRFTGKPYLEAHHLIPMSLQKETDKQLDTINNIFCLCPYCHRAIHHSEKKTTRNMIETLVDRRPSVLGILDNDVSDIFNFYAVEEIA
jgi:hypothetical protein